MQGHRLLELSRRLERLAALSVLAKKKKKKKKKRKDYAGVPADSYDDTTLDEGGEGDGGD